MNIKNYIVAQDNSATKGEDERLARSFCFSKWFYEKNPTKKEKLGGAKLQVLNVVVGKPTANSFCELIADFTAGFEKENYSTLVTKAERYFQKGISLHVKEVQEQEDKRIMEFYGIAQIPDGSTWKAMVISTGHEMHEEDEGFDPLNEKTWGPAEEKYQPEVFRTMGIFLRETIKEQDSTASLADPQRDAKVQLSKADIYNNLDYSTQEKINTAAETWKNNRLAEIERIFEKMMLLSPGEMQEFITLKFKDCGLDDNGYLRMKKESIKEAGTPITV